MPPYFITHAKEIGKAIERIGLYREAVGNDVDLCIEVHRRLKTADAVVFARGIEPFYPYFIEDPIGADNFDSMAEVADKINIPIATGERLNNPQEFAMLIRRNVVAYVRPDVCMCGGHYRCDKSGGAGRSQRFDGRTTQPTQPGVYRRLFADRRQHSEFCPAGVSRG